MLSRPQLYALGCPRWRVRLEVRAGRWQRVGDQSVCLHNGPLSFTGDLWAAVLQAGPRALLDGEAALVAGGLTGHRIERIRVSVPRGARIRRTARYDIRQTRRWAPEDLAPGSGVRRTRPAVAALRAALWAVSDKQAAYVVTAVVQQGLVTPQALGTELLRIRRDRRRTLLHEIVNDLLDGARSLGELDVGRELRRRGLRAPDRQVLRRDGRRRYYLDLFWTDLGLVVEIDGIHHTWAENVLGDALRQNSLVLDGLSVLRVPLLGLRLAPDDFFDQIACAIEGSSSRSDAAA